MSDQINQIQATYDSKEDRILLKFKTQGDAILHAWMTRRFTKLLLPILQGQNPVSGESLLQEKAQLVSQMQQEKAASEADFSSQFNAPSEPNYPIGELPILLTQISFKDLKGEQPKFILEPDDGAGLVLPYSGELLGPLLKIVHAAVEKAEWNFDRELILNLPQVDAPVH